MKPREVITTIKQASPLDVLLLIFLLIPIVIGGWLVILDSLDLPGRVKIITVTAVSGLFVILALVAYSRTWTQWKRAKRLLAARNIIARYMDEKGRETISVKAVNSHCEKITATNDLFYDLIDEYPSDFSLAWSKSKILLLSRVLSQIDVDDPPEG